MSSILISRTVAVVAMIAVPALFVFARSDLGSWTSFSEQRFLSLPFGYFPFACAAFTILLGLAGGSYSIIRTLAVAAICVGLAYAAPVAAWPVLFGVGEACSPALATFVFVLLVLPAGLAQALLLRGKQTQRRWQVLAHALVMCGVSILMLSIKETRCGGATTAQFSFFQAWPIIFAVLPYMVLLIREAVAVPAWRLVTAFVIAVAPVYATKAAFDHREGFTLRASVWPVRVWTDFSGFYERRERRKQLALILPNVPSPIGEHTYNFARFEYQRDMPEARPPRQSNRISGTILGVLIDDLGLPELFSQPGRKTISLFIVSDGRQDGRPLIVPRTSTQLSASDVRYRDLTITFTLRPVGTGPRTTN